MFSNILLGAAGFPVADLGDTVQHSLRFNRNQWLASPAVTLSTYTASIWLKLGRMRNPSVSGGVTQIIIGTAGTGGHGVGFSNNKLYSTHTGDESTEEFRDPSGWYHLVINSTGNLYINNVEIATGGGLHDPNNEEIVLGHVWPQNSQNSTYAFEGLLANYHFIDGQELTPTSFGRTNDDGVWVPKDYTGTYGTNGARLIFDSSAGIGNDTSGNNNDYSIGGTFDTGDVVLYSSMLFSDNTTSSTASDINFNSTSTSWSSNTPPTGFNGNTGDFVQSSGTWIFRPTTPLTNVTQVEVFCTNSSPNQQLFLNSANVGGSYTHSQYNTIYSGAATTINNIAGNFTGGGNGFSAIRINGSTVLTDNTDNDVDFKDTPTSNYATLNALAAVPTTFTEANLKHGNSGTSAWEQATPTIHLTSGKWYWEVLADGSASWGIGIADQRWDINANDNFIGGLAGSVGYNGANGNKHVDGTASSYGNTYTAGDIIGVALDLENNAVWFSKNGTWQNSATQSEVEAGTTTNAAATGLTQEIYYPVCVNSGSGSNWKWNLGQMNFIYTKPSGYNALQTNNLPEPTIKNGKEYFETIIWDGNDVDDRAITTTEEFAPDLVWIKCRDANSTNHEVYDTIRGAGNRILPNLVNEQDSPTGNLKSFTTTGFTLGTSGNVNGTGNSYVAWCWKAGDTFTPSQTGGLTNLSGTRNTTAGFSIIRYRGVSANATVGHGLNSTPEFIIFKDYSDTNQENWNIYHSAFRPRAAQGETINFNTSSAADYGATLYNSTAPTSSVIHLGNNVDINDSGEDVIAYCWHSVEGYSKFGQYEGNGTSDDGPFVYTGHAPQFLIIKAMDVSGDWVMLDSIRTPNNPNDVAFKGNSAIQEAADSNYTVDFLSNGFKIRNNADADLNQSNRTYIYMSWALHPFGGENAPPVTAR